MSGEGVHIRRDPDFGDLLIWTILAGGREIGRIVGYDTLGVSPRYEVNMDSVNGANESTAMRRSFREAAVVARRRARMMIAGGAGE